jgi:acetyl-CoA carboxylase biotin carboxylase subunit
VLKNETFLKGEYDTGFIENQFDMEDLQRRQDLDVTVPVIAAAIKQLLSEKIAAARAVTRPDTEESDWKRFGKIVNFSKTLG